MPTKLIAWLLSFLAAFAFWNKQGQPNQIPETRSSPYQHVPDKYGVWPTKEFTLGDKLLVPDGALKAVTATHGFFKGVKLDSFLVLYKGELIREEYYNGYGKDDPHFVASVTKAVVSALVGIAVGEGLIKGVDQKVLDFFPEAVKKPGWQQSKRDITIEHLLTMTSGILAETDAEWDGFFDKNQKDSALYAFLLPQKADPGERYMYCSAAPSILLGIIQRASGRSALKYANEKLFKPLGMASVKWDTAADGLPFGGFGIEMTPRDMARFGYLYLNYGRWDGKQIMPADWVAVTPPKSKHRVSYGYMFWNGKLAPFSGFYDAAGAYEQHITILPKWDMVIVSTAQEK